MAVIERWFNQDLKHPVNTRMLGNLYYQDGNSLKIGVTVNDNGQPYTLSGSVTGYCVISDGYTIPIIGHISGNTAYIILPPNAYLVLGMVYITLKNAVDDVVTTILSCVGVVVQTRTSNQADPGQIIDDWTRSINASLAQVEMAAQNVADILAPGYDTSATYQVGDYVTYMGHLYRCTTAIDTPEYWTAEHWTATDVSDMATKADIATVAELKAYLGIE